MKRIIFCNTAWMDFYRGFANDKMIGGGAHIKETGWGFEMLNFKPSKGKYYGYVRVSRNRQINIKRLGAKDADQKLDKVTIVWTARHPQTGGTLIVGWYKNATLYRHPQSPAKSLNRRWKNQTLEYCAVANVSESRLLSRDERVISIPRGMNGMGQTNIWYADQHPDFVNIIEKYIYSGKIPPEHRGSSGKGKPRQADPLKRKEIEAKAIEVVFKYFDSLGYLLDSVEKDNVGWDLNATKGKISLKLEVKGLSGCDIATELTPNEYSKLWEHKHDYRLCVVTETLTSPKLRTFSYSEENKSWSSDDGTTLRIEKFTGAKIYTK